MPGLFRKGFLILLFCSLLSVSAVAVETVVPADSTADSETSRIPHDSDDDSLSSPIVDSSDSPVVSAPIPDDSAASVPVSVDVSGTDEPVTVDTEETEKQIILNVTVTPPSVDVKSESPIVNVEAPVVNVDVPAAVPASVPVDSTDGSVGDDSGNAGMDDEEMEPVPVFIPFTSLSLESDSSGSTDDTPGDTVRYALTSLFGEYKPRTQTVIKVLEDGSEVSYQEYVPGLAGLDVPWLASVVVFMVMLFCFFRLLGGVLSRG